MRTVRLGDVAKIDISNVNKKSNTSETPIVLCNFVDVYHNWAITKEMTSSFMKATASDRQIERFRLRKGQVAITKDSETRDDIGIATYIADDIDDCVLGYHCVLITPDERVLRGKYLNIVMHSPYAQKYFEANASGSGQRYTLTNEIVADFPVPMPEISAQDRYGRLCSRIDEKMTNNVSICSDLEAMAKLLYDYWFVQFDFPDENGNPYKSSGGKMVWSEELQREMPESWCLVRLSGIAQLVNERIRNDVLNCDTYIGTDNLIDDMRGRQRSDYVPKVGYSVKFAKSDILISNIRPYFKKIWYSDIDGGCSSDVLVLRSTSLISHFVYSTLARDAFFDYDMAGAKGSKMPRGDKAHIMNYPIPFNCSLAEEYSRRIKDWRTVIAEKYYENQQLASLRDFLIPMLMNGQAKLADVS